MRWTIVVVLCLAVASAKHGKKSRFGQMLQKVADLESEIERDFDDSWSDDDSEEDIDDYESRQEPQHRRYQPRKQKPCPYCTDRKGRAKWLPKDQEDYESQEDDEYDQRSKPKKHHQRREGEDDEPVQPCRPKFDLLQELGEVNAQLAAKLHRESKQLDNDKNTVVSPVSVQLALAAVAQGARGNTKRQLSQILDFGLQKNQYKNAYAALTRTLKGEGTHQDESKVAQIKCTTNLVLSQESAQKEFIEAIRNCFDCEVKKCDFRQKPQHCRDQINQWVTSKTGLKSQNVLTQTSVTGSTKMISIGTMHLKTSWGKQFRKNLRAEQGQFYPLGEQRPVSVKTLQTEGEFSFFEDEQMKVLGIPTQEKELTMYVILPKERHGLNQLEKHHIQYGQQLQQVLNRCDSRKQSIKVQLPVFQVTYKMDTKQMLRKLGVEAAFEGDQADFSGISDDTESEEVLHYGRRTGGLEDIDVKKASQQYRQEHQLYLNKLIQLSSIQIDENGIDAATGTKSSKSKPTQSEEREDPEDYEKSGSRRFKADHAFAFIIKHNPSNQMLLVGRVVDASQKAESETNRESESE